jgi:hypothetical protein
MNIYDAVLVARRQVLMAASMKLRETSGILRHIPTEESVLGIHRRGGWLGPRAYLDVMVETSRSYRESSFYRTTGFSTHKDTENIY